MKNINCITVDLGATSGRVILTRSNDGNLDMEIVHRFPNTLFSFNNRYYWNIYSLFDNIKEGLRIAAKKEPNISSLGVDTWGVDIVYVGKDGSFLDLPRAYRDPYTNKAMEQVFSVIPKEEVYEKTGIQFMNFNTLFQLHAAKKEKVEALKHADKALFMPDAISYMLTGKQVCEYTILSTSQMLNPMTKEIETDFLKRLGLRTDLFPDVVMPGTLIGTLLPELAKEVGLNEVPVIAVAGHDTASAIAAIPALGKDFAYISSGTWSLIGIESEEPIINKESFDKNFTNEGGINGTTRFLKNVTGLWLLEQCLQAWKREGREYTYPQIVAMAESVQDNKIYIDPDHTLFANPKSMPEAIRTYCVETRQRAPENDTEFIRCIFESLALKYAVVLEYLKEMASFDIKKLHIIGGGSQNELLNQFAANASGLEVIAGPSEATAYGNALIQLKTLGVYKTIEEMRSVLLNSLSLKHYQPQAPAVWEAKLNEFKQTIF